jgi:cytoskeletal protein CcmA (bactofilin family)
MLKFNQPRKDEPLPPKVEPAPAPSLAPGQPVVRAPLAAPAPETRRVEEPPMPASSRKDAESILAAGITIEGKIEGNGNVRVVGRFKGNVNVKGELTVEPGASIEGEIRADSVLVAGEVKGQIVAASRVELNNSGTLIGDVKASSVTVAAGSKMRGRVDFGWKEGEGESAPSDNGSPLPSL